MKFWQSLESSHIAFDNINNRIINIYFQFLMNKILFINRRPYYDSLYTINKEDLAEYDISQINFDTLMYALQLCLFNVLPSIQYKDDYDKPDKIYLKSDKSQLLQFNQISKNLDGNGMKEFLCQLYICLLELQNRGLHLRGISLSQIWFIDKIPIISIQDIDFSLPIGKDSTQSRILDLMDTVKQQIVNQQLPNFSTMQQLNFNYDDYIKASQINQIGLKPNFFSYIKSLMQFDKFNQLSLQMANSCVCLIENNNLINLFITKHKKKNDDLFYQKPNQLVFKTTKLEDNQDNSQILINIERELNFLEKLKESDQFVELYFYMRFQNQAYFFLRNYPFDLSSYSKKFSSQKDDWIKFVYMFAKQFAESLKTLHEMNIIHRDLKPQNVFLRDPTFPQNQIVIADFDRSKTLMGMYQIEQQTNYEDGMTLAYDPPELYHNQQTNKNDIWQYGLILLEIANFGKYYGYQHGLAVIQRPDYEKKFSTETIYMLLKDHYSIEFINVINSCLQYEPNKRPTASDLQREVGKIFRSRYISCKQVL
ncbi:hypothetical protein pb186bvf_009142 [Paramecium bursaria]